MKTKIKEKIHSQSGVSFLFGLLAFLVAAMVSVTIVTAASTTMKRVHNDRKEQQELLTLNSAAQFVRDEMLKTKYITTVETKKDSYGNDSSVTTTYTSEGTFAPEMKAAVERVNTGSSYVSVPSAITLDVDGMEMQTVKASFTMSAEGTEKYRVIFTIYIEESGNTLFLTMSGSTSEKTDTSTSGGITTIKKASTISWGSPVISSLGE